MIIGTARIELHIPGVNSLKGKRQIIKSIKERIRNRFNVSIAEVEKQDLWQRAALGLACVANDKAQANRILSKVINFIEQNKNISLIDYEIEIF
ncbi:DUF503 domain-containing protein [bacterium]|nr:DUF503 domain-containing protein [bacterium]MCG2676368.1 DUF503 domain-containing protein [bacterium]MCG2678265.1 DUF503 domain-containing protein [bacterium]